jgi:hypothetical protein
VGIFTNGHPLYRYTENPLKGQVFLVTIEIACVPWYQSRILRQLKVQVCSKQLIAGNSMVLREKPGLERQ